MCRPLSVHTHTHISRDTTFARKCVCLGFLVVNNGRTISTVAQIKYNVCELWTSRNVWFRLMVYIYVTRCWWHRVRWSETSESMFPLRIRKEAVFCFCCFQSKLQISISWHFTLLGKYDFTVSNRVNLASNWTKTTLNYARSSAQARTHTHTHFFPCTKVDQWQSYTGLSWISCIRRQGPFHKNSTISSVQHNKRYFVNSKMSM